MAQSPILEFFHDTICSFCFPMSYKMRKVQEAIPQLEIQHRSFALVPQEVDFDIMFPSRTAAKNEVLTHWQHANQTDPLHRFNIEGMRKADFLFPYSMPSLYACKAAYYVSGNSGYWDLFDSLQNSFFVKNLNIQNDDVIFQAVQNTSLNFDEWQKHYSSPQVKQSVSEDLALAEEYGIHEVPTLVVNQKYKINGALTIEELTNTIQNIL